MPLVESSSKTAREKNVKREIAAGKDPKQAVAISYAVQRKNSKDASPIADALRCFINGMKRA